MRQLLAGNSARMMNLIDDYDSELLSTVDDLKDAAAAQGKTAHLLRRRPLGRPRVRRADCLSSTST